jgi:pimeloyl-ACP methyl ester carboxylesterase
MELTFERDGYLIHYTVTGAGPRLVWVDPALGSSVMRPLQEAVDVLAQRFEVITYDRRGRGRNAPARDLSTGDEVADLQALLAHVGGAEVVLGFSSGAALVLHAAARGLPTRMLVLLEPAVDAEPDETGLRDRLDDALAQGDDEGAVRAFYDATGVPDDIVEHLVTSEAWPRLVRSAPTLLVDIDLGVVGDDTLAALDLPVHVVVSTGSPDEITGMSEELSRRLDGTVWREPGGWHGVEAAALAERLAALVPHAAGSDGPTASATRSAPADQWQR